MALDKGTNLLGEIKFGENTEYHTEEAAKEAAASRCYMAAMVQCNNRREILILILRCLQIYAVFFFISLGLIK